MGGGEWTPQVHWDSLWRAPPAPPGEHGMGTLHPHKWEWGSCFWMKQLSPIQALGSVQTRLQNRPHWAQTAPPTLGARPTHPCWVPPCVPSVELSTGLAKPQVGSRMQNGNSCWGRTANTSQHFPSPESEHAFFLFLLLKRPACSCRVFLQKKRSMSAIVL